MISMNKFFNEKLYFFVTIDQISDTQLTIQIVKPFCEKKNYKLMTH